jgi:hypothetical protein
VDADLVIRDEDLDAFAEILQDRPDRWDTQVTDVDGLAAPSPIILPRSMASNGGAKAGLRLAVGGRYRESTLRQACSPASPLGHVIHCE